MLGELLLEEYPVQVESHVKLGPDPPCHQRSTLYQMRLAGRLGSTRAGQITAAESFDCGNDN